MAEYERIEIGDGTLIIDDDNTNTRKVVKIKPEDLKHPLAEIIREAEQKLNDIISKKLDETGVCFANDPDIAPYLWAIGIDASNPPIGAGWTNVGYSRNLQS